MYIPPYYKETDFPTLLDFIQQHPFAPLCSSAGGKLKATHLPFVVEEKQGLMYITGHMSKANDQWKDLETGTEAMLLFQGPHAYVSPAHYEKIQNVPTWNYIAVHAYGTARIIHDKVESYAVLDKMIRLYEPAYLSQWEGLPETYREGMLKGIVSFEITVTKLEGKYKLSQNKTDKERERIVDSFEKSPDEGARRLAEEMKRRDYGIM